MLCNTGLTAASPGVLKNKYVFQTLLLVLLVNLQILWGEPKWVEGQIATIVLGHSSDEHERQRAWAYVKISSYACLQKV